MEDFDSLEACYAYLEQNALNYKFLHQIADLFHKVRDKMHTEKKIAEEAKAQWEMDVFNFSISKNIIGPLFEGTNAKGEKVSYPNFDTFIDATYEYIQGRLASTANPLLRARYAHVLWLSPRKHGTYAELAVDAYIELIKAYELKDKESPNEHHGLDVLDAAENAFYTAMNIKDMKRIQAVKSEIIRLINKYNPQSSSLFRLRAELINLMLTNLSVFLNADFTGMNNLCFDFAQHTADLYLAITMYEIGEKIEQKLKTSTHNWKQLIAEAYERMMLANKENNKQVAIFFCQQALKYYRQIDDLNRVTELEKVYSELKGATEFKKTEVKIDLEPYVKECETKAKGLVDKHTAEQILMYLATGENIIPKQSEMKKLAEELLKQHPLQKMMPIVLLDERGHNAEHFTTEEEIAFFKTLEQYKMYLETQHIIWINAIIFQAIQDEKITLPIVLDYFRNHSWFGKTLILKTQNQEIPYNWLGLLAPSIHDYLNRLDYLMQSGKYPNMTLCTDSLVLKIEGLIRDLCSHCGVTTFYSSQDKQGRIIYREKDLNALLHDDKIKTLFSEDDLLFLKFVLVEKAGYNLRHKVAHSLMIANEYGIDNVHLLLLILLRIGLFDFKKKETSKTEVEEKQKA